MNTGVAFSFPVPSAVGYSFSPGGLLFPYHLGVITGLNYHERLPPSVHLAGASAGAIAVAAHASQTPPEKALEAACRVCEECDSKFNGRAIGNLLPLLKDELDKTFHQDAHMIINEREGIVALAHRELFPNNRPVLTTNFDTRDDLIEAVCDSSMFPFFSTPFPVRLRYKANERFPRVIVDGFFSVPR
jgi:predicted acylesterase/phospholipase RssA